MSVKDRYYNKKEYSKLLLAEKKGLKEKRKQRNKGKDGSDQPNKKKKIKWDERTIKAIATEVASAMKPSEDEQGEPEPAPESAQQNQMTGCNRTNRALGR
mmetsp:Transcript_14720/g.21199  ORF Transcript_14720/g.21199 Transcript_14720/m.21199 type:complete len:100 (-) Transcript_14720:2376-2675(-)